ncbi:MAG: tandem-95 repeat protein [Aureliella sp.]
MPRLPFLNRRQSGNRARPNSRTSSIRRFRRSLVAGLETLENRQLLAADVLLADSFEAGFNSNDWVGNWVEDSQNDWFRSTQRATDGSRSAEVDGSANNATLTLSDPIDLSDYDSAELTFDWLIESGFDSGEYLALDISSDGGSSWDTSVLQLDGNSDPENQWQSETVDLTPYKSSDVLVRFRAKVSRWNEDANVDNVKITGERSESEFPATISYPDFSDSTGLTLLDDAAIANGNTLRLTPAASSMEGAAWHTDKQFVSVDWETSFDFNLNENTGNFGGSDGFTFVIQNHAPTYLAGGGGTLGYDALPNSLVVEFDTYLNADVNDPSESHISIHTNGTGPNSWDESLSIGSFDTPSLMDDATTHSVKIQYVSGQLQVFYDGSLSPVITADVDLNELLDLDAGKAWVGFTAAAGGGVQNHDILNWEYRVLADTSSTVAVSNSSVIEGDGGTADLVFQVVRDGDISSPATVDWSLAAGSAIPGVDYVNTTGQISFAAGEAAKPIVVTVNGDAVEEDDETLRVQLANLSSGILVVDEAVGTILNDDTSVSISDVTVTEGDSTLSLLGNFVTEGSGGLTRPRVLEFGPDGNGDGVEDLYVASVDTNEILRYDGATGDFLDPFITGEPLLNNPLDFAFSPENGDLYVLSGTNSDASVLRFDDAGQLVEATVTGLVAPWGLSFFESGDKFGNMLLTDRDSDRVLLFDGTSLTDFVSSGSGGLDNPRNAIVGPDGDVYVASRDTLQVLKYSGADGQFDRVVVDIPLSSISYIEFGSDGLLYATGRSSSVCCDTTLLQIDVVSGAVLQTLPLERDGWSFTVGPNDVIYNSGNGFGNFVDLSGAASSASFEVTLSKPSAVPVTVDFSTLGSSASAGLDFVPASGTVTFEPGVTSRTILVSTLDDETGEGDETFEVQLSGVQGASLADSMGTGTIQDDDAVNQASTANNDSAPTLEDQAVSIDVLANDSDPEDDALSIDSVTQPAFGLTVIEAGQVRYMPNANFYGSDSFTYTIVDSAGNTATASVDVTVTPVNDAPIAAVDSFSLDQDTRLTIDAPGVLVNDSDVDGDLLTASVVSGPASGSLSLDLDGSFTYEPAAGFSGTDSFTYQAVDPSGASSDPVTVSLQVNPVAGGPNLSHGSVVDVGDIWQTVSLGMSYDSAVVVATPRYNNGSGPGVVRVRNVTSTSFDVRVDSVGSSAFSGGIHFIAMEEGVYDVPGEYKLEAVKVNQAGTSRRSGWQINSQGYAQSYSNPVVVGQVMSTNDDWSVFWSSSSSRTSPANSGSLNVGKHVGEDSDTTRNTETLGYFVIEATSSGTIDGLNFSAGVGSDTIRGVGNGTYQYSGVNPSGATTAVLSGAGMDGNDGGWAVLRGTDPLASNSIQMSIDEDQIGDSERNHTTEQVAYFVIGESAEGEASQLAIPEIRIHDPMDVNGDGFTSPLDALAVVNALNAEPGTGLEEGDMALDTNGDGYLSALDALLVVNHLNASPPTPEGKSSGSNESLIDGFFGSLEEDDEDDRLGFGIV